MKNIITWIYPTSCYAIISRLGTKNLSCMKILTNGGDRWTFSFCFVLSLWLLCFGSHLWSLLHLIWYINALFHFVCFIGVLLIVGLVHFPANFSLFECVWIERKWRKIIDFWSFIFKKIHFFRLKNHRFKIFFF